MLFLHCVLTADTNIWGQTPESSLNTTGIIAPCMCEAPKPAKDSRNKTTMTHKTASLYPNDSYMQPFTVHLFLKTTLCVGNPVYWASEAVRERSWIQNQLCGCRTHRQIQFSKCIDMSVWFPKWEALSYHPEGQSDPVLPNYKAHSNDLGALDGKQILTC